MIFGIKQKTKKINNFAPYNAFLAIATNKPQWLKTGFVVQGHTVVEKKNIQKLLTNFTNNYKETHWIKQNFK